MGAAGNEARLARIGVPGIDAILFGGFPRNAVHLIAGEPGTGKTTLGLQFLLAGAAASETGLFITLAQSARDLARIAASHGFDLSGIAVEEISALELARESAERQSVLHTSEVELSALMGTIRAMIERVKPDRVVFDSLFEVRLLARDMLGYRRELILLKEFAVAAGATALFLDYPGPVLGDRQLEGLAHGVVLLDSTVPQYGASLRRLCIAKMRGHAFVEGFHDLVIRRGGIAVFPRVVPEHATEVLPEGSLACAIPELDEMLGGGLEPGTTCLIVGQAGTGKSTLGTAYARAAAARGERAAMFLFEERPEVFRRRSRDIGLELGALERAGDLRINHYNPAEISPGEFAQAVVNAVEHEDARVVVIDSLTGYLGALPDGRNLIVQLHSLLSFLSRRNVLTILIMAQHGLLGGSTHMEADTSYLADTVVLLRYADAGADLRRTVTVVKKRHGDHDTASRELVIGASTVTVRDARRG